MPKPQNNGQILTVRISPESHAAIARILARLAEKGELPSLRTKARVVEQAVQYMEATWPGE